MARLDGGIFSRPRGKTANIVFGAARTREGKVVTARELVPPSNPNTSAQQTQRSKFKEALEIVRKIGKSIYGSDLNRAVSQLPGFQGLMSVLMNNMNDSYGLSAPATLNLGNLHFPDSFDLILGTGTTQIAFDISTETGPNGTVSDTMMMIAIEKAAAANPQDRDVVVNTNFQRDSVDPQVTVANGSTDYLCLLYFRGAGAASGLLSSAVWGIGTSTAS